MSKTGSTQEVYYKKGKSNINFFNYVIYRSNQAYEGALKESYKVLADKTDNEVSKKTTNDIEKFFEEHDIFRERVLALFKNYRQEWRNKSTHGFNLFFDESEVFLALMSVSSFIHLLLKQIQEKIAYQSGQKKLAEDKENAEKIKIIAISINRNPMDKIVDMIIEFSKQNSQQIFDKGKEIREVEIMGLFHAYIESVNKTINIQREPKVNISGQNIRVDFLIEIDNKSLIIEVKKARVTVSQMHSAIDQVLIYMQVTNIFHGIIYYANFGESNPKPKVIKIESVVNDKKYEIIAITT